MKYSIMVVFNSSYFPFGRVWINSLYDKNDMSKVDKVFIVDTGLKKEEKDYFSSKGDEVYIYNTGLDTDFNDGGAWGKGWQENVGSKTIVFKHLLEMTQKPLVMVDGDCSFVIGQPRNATSDFMTLWIDRIATTPTNVPRESPSLSEIAYEKNHFANVGDVDRILVSTHNENEFCDDTYIIHLKSATVDRRIDARLRQYLIESPNFRDIILRYSDV